jgi:hypothetical protein
MIKINVPAETLIMKKGIMILEHCKVIEKVSNTLIIILTNYVKQIVIFKNAGKQFSVYISFLYLIKI